MFTLFVTTCRLPEQLPPTLVFDEKPFPCLRSARSRNSNRCGVAHFQKHPNNHPILLYDSFDNSKKLFFCLWRCDAKRICCDERLGCLVPLPDTLRIGTKVIGSGIFFFLLLSPASYTIWVCTSFSNYLRSDEVVDGWLVVVRYREGKTADKRVNELGGRVAALGQKKGLNLRYRKVDARPKKSASKL